MERNLLKEILCLVCLHTGEFSFSFNCSWVWKERCVGYVGWLCAYMSFVVLALGKHTETWFNCGSKGMNGSVFQHWKGMKLEGSLLTSDLCVFLLCVLQSSQLELHLHPRRCHFRRKLSFLQPRQATFLIPPSDILLT